MIAENDAEQNALLELRKALFGIIDATVLSKAIPKNGDLDSTFEQPKKLFSEAEILELRRNSRSAQEGQRFVFRRETPVVSSAWSTSSPDWANGVAIDQSLGPFRDIDGRQYWFDFFSFSSNLIPLYMGDEDTPTIIFQGRVTDLKQALGSRPGTYRIPAGSVWIRANAFTSVAPTGYYAGLKIVGGQLKSNQRLSVRPQEVRTIRRSNTILSFELDIDSGEQEGSNNARTGDLLSSTITMPSQFSFNLTNRKFVIQGFSRARWTLFDQECTFRRDVDTTPGYSAQMQSVLLRCETSLSTVQTVGQQNDLLQLSGSGEINRAAWLIPVTRLDLNEGFPNAAGAGAMGVQNTTGGLRLQWNGLQGELNLRNPWITFGTDRLELFDNRAGNIKAIQTFQLWQEKKNSFPATVDLSFGDRQLFRYVATPGVETLTAEVNLDGRLNKPLDTSGQPVVIASNKAELRIIFAGLRRVIQIQDNNMILDNASTNGQQTLISPLTMAIRNALLQTTPVSHFFLSGSLGEDNTIIQGQVRLVMGLLGILPILPDPYAAKTSDWEKQFPFRRTPFVVDELPNIIQAVLFTRCNWTVNSQQERGSVNTSFSSSLIPPGVFVPNPKSSTIATGSITSYHPWIVKLREVCYSKIDLILDPASSMPADWDRHFSILNADLFTLLDVSSNMDQTGVSLACLENTGEAVMTHWFVPTHFPQQSNNFPIQVQGMDLSAQADQLLAIMPPQISWEPVRNLDNPEDHSSLTGETLYFPNDGSPTQLGSVQQELVPIAPGPLTDFLVDSFNAAENGANPNWAHFTLPWGLRAFTRLFRGRNRVEMVRPEFENERTGGRQILLRGRLANGQRVFNGLTYQENNVHTISSGANPALIQQTRSILGDSLTEIFNNQFFYDTQGELYEDGRLNTKRRGVPLERIGLSGYGASTFSDWKDPEASIAAVSKVQFDIWVGRTAQETIQVSSVIYPWAIPVFRTITIFRLSNARVYRHDSGWQAKTPGVFDFASIEAGVDPQNQVADDYEIHPGLIQGVFDVRNIVELEEFEPFTISSGEGVELKPVYFDAEVAIEGVVRGGTGEGRLPAQNILGFVQIVPSEQLITPTQFHQLMLFQDGTIGAEVDGVIDLAQSGQMMRIQRVDVNGVSNNGPGTFDFALVGAVRGSVRLPRDGSWSVVQHFGGEIRLLDEDVNLSAIRRGRISNGNFPNPGQELVEVANPENLFQSVATSTHIGFLQDTGTQKMLFSRPRYEQNQPELRHVETFFTDAMTLLNSAAPFPNLDTAFPVDLDGNGIGIIEEGYQLVNGPLNTALEQRVLKLVDLTHLKIYAEYQDATEDSSHNRTFSLQYGLNAVANGADRWSSDLSQVAIVVHLGPVDRLMTISGIMEAGQGRVPHFSEPEIKFSSQLEPLLQVVQILEKIQQHDPTNPQFYGDIINSGLKIAFSNSPLNWDYKFAASKEIPLVRFPIPMELFNSAMVSMKLEAGLALGIYIGGSIRPTDDFNQLIPDTRAFIEFFGRVYVMVISVGVGTIFAIGEIRLRFSADIDGNLETTMLISYGGQIVLAIPLFVNVSVAYQSGIQLSINNDETGIGGMVNYRGRAEVLSGLVAIDIMIEAIGSIIVDNDFLNPFDDFFDGLPRMVMRAQLTFAVDVRVCWVFSISFERSWEDTRQVSGPLQ